MIYFSKQIFFKIRKLENLGIKLRQIMISEQILDTHTRLHMCANYLAAQDSLEEPRYYSTTVASSPDITRQVNVFIRE